jgi:hypothetical protein
MTGGLAMHAIVGPAIGAVNPSTPATIMQSSGSTLNPDGTRTPTYTETAMRIQVQALTSGDLARLDGLNLQGVMKAVYLTGRWHGAVRVGQQGGDLLKFHGQTWLVVAPLEPYRTWTKLAVALQNGS